ncbi:MAG: MBL fold metallo-hydrolase [Acidobacteriota bacterium]
MNKQIKRRGFVAAGVLLIAAAGLGLGAVDGPLREAVAAPAPPGMWPPAQPPESLAFSMIHTGHSEGVSEALVVGGGRWLTRRFPSQSAVLIRHPRGNVLFDTGLGRHVQEQFAANTWLDRQFFAFVAGQPAADQLQAAGWRPQSIGLIVPSHMHWDHVSGLPDFPDATVMVPAVEREEAARGHAPAFLRSQFEGMKQWRDLTFDQGPYMGYPASRDLYGDGALVFVPLSGHTAGQVGLFLTLPSGRRFFFTGDVTWTMEGFVKPADRSWLLRQLVHVDHDEAQNQAAILRVHQLMKRYPTLTVVPAHDENVLQRLPRFPHFQG